MIDQYVVFGPSIYKIALAHDARDALLYYLEIGLGVVNVVI